MKMMTLIAFSLITGASACRHGQSDSAVNEGFGTDDSLESRIKNVDCVATVMAERVLSGFEVVGLTGNYIVTLKAHASSAQCRQMLRDEVLDIEKVEALGEQKLLIKPTLLARVKNVPCAETAMNEQSHELGAGSSPTGRVISIVVDENSCADEVERNVSRVTIERHPGMLIIRSN